MILCSVYIEVCSCMCVACNCGHVNNLFAHARSHASVLIVNLDLIIAANNEDIVHNVYIHPQKYQSMSSVMSFTIKSNTDYTTSKIPQVIFDFSKASYPGLINYLSYVDLSLCDQLSDIDSIWLFIKTSSTKGMNLFIPKIRFSSSSFPKWYTSDIRHQIKYI